MQKHEIPARFSPSSLRSVVLISIILSASLSPSMAGDEVLPVIQDAFIKGGEAAGEVMPVHTLEVAARALDAMRNVRKTFLQFDVDASLLSNAVSARVVLTSQSAGIIVFKDDPREPVELVLSGVPNAEWDETTLHWENAPGHDKKSSTDDGTPDLQVLAVATLNPLTVAEDGKLTFKDPRLLEFLRKHRGVVTFLITSNAPPKYPGFNFFSKDGTGRPERRPMLILETK